MAVATSRTEASAVNFDILINARSQLVASLLAISNLDVVLPGLCDLDLPTESCPEGGVGGVLVHDGNGGGAATLGVADLVDYLDGLGLLVLVGGGAVVEVEAVGSGVRRVREGRKERERETHTPHKTPLPLAAVEDEAVAGVEGSVGDRHGYAANGALPLDEEEAGLVEVPVDVGEAAVDAPGKVLDAGVLEVREEHGGLAAFDFPVLHGAATEALVELHGLVSTDSDLVLRRLGSEPEVDVPV